MTSRTGTIIRDGETATIRFERRLPYPIEAVWAALTDPAELIRWFPLEAEASPGIGGEIVMRWPGSKFDRTSGGSFGVPGT